MTCFRPLHGWESQTKNPSGKRSVVFNSKYGFLDKPMSVPCGRCIGCRLEKSRAWALRCMNEAQLHENNIFITLTYSEENLPKNHSLDKSHFQKFMKDLRSKIDYNILTGNKESKIDALRSPRYYHCGEYGDTNLRPHYHAILFGIDFLDKEKHTKKETYQLYTSKTLEELWGKGHCLIGDVTFDSAAYVARYTLKKITGNEAEENYQRYSTNDGEIFKIEPEYCTMSRNPGIGKEWYKKYKNDLYNKDHITVNGKPVKAPRYYDKLFELDENKKYRILKYKRKKTALLNGHKTTDERLSVREKIQHARQNFFTRRTL